jgi:alkylation response protein AidB-like acyl-CoA dehydrogenase
VNSYLVPLEESRFVLRELADLDRVAQLPNAEVLADAELTDSILIEASRLAEGVLEPLNATGDRDGARWSAEGVKATPGFKDAYRRYVEGGWNRLAMPTEYGGQGMPTLLSAAVREIFIGANKAFCMCPGLTDAAVHALMLGADDALKAYYLPRLVSGEWTATMNLTEPQAGSDVGALRTRAVPAGDGTYRVFGQKIFISFGDHDLTDNIVHLVLARVAGAPEGSKGISLFVVPKLLPQEGWQGARNDVQCAGIEHKVGNHGSPTCTMVYGGAGEGAVAWLLGEENKGLQTMFVMMNQARILVGMEGVALSERAYRQALAYARERVQGRAAAGSALPVPIIRHPDVRRMLLSMRSQTEAMRALGYMLAGALDLADGHPDTMVRQERQDFVDLMIPIFKGWATETAVEVTRTSVQIHGGMGYVTESGASQPLRDVLIAPIYEGTTGIQANDLIARKVLRDGGASLNRWLAQVDRTLAETAAQPALADLASRLGQGVASVRMVAQWIAQAQRERPLDVLAVAVPFLKLAGIVAGGWLMTRAALAASRLLDAGDASESESFLRAKLASARFYATHVLPQAGALAVTAMNGSDATLDEWALQA